jgi:hypothetical protein
MMTTNRPPHTIAALRSINAQMQWLKRLLTLPEDDETKQMMRDLVQGVEGHVRLAS